MFFSISDQLSIRNALHVEQFSLRVNLYLELEGYFHELMPYDVGKIRNQASGLKRKMRDLKRE
jgi:hypothetical protein